MSSTKGRSSALIQGKQALTVISEGLHQSAQTPYENKKSRIFCIPQVESYFKVVIYSSIYVNDVIPCMRVLTRKELLKNEMKGRSHEYLCRQFVLGSNGR